MIRSLWYSIPDSELSLAVSLNKPLLFNKYNQPKVGIFLISRRSEAKIGASVISYAYEICTVWRFRFDMFSRRYVGALTIKYTHNILTPFPAINGWLGIPHSTRGDAVSCSSALSKVWLFRGTKVIKLNWIGSHSMTASHWSKSLLMPLIISTSTSRAWSKEIGTMIRVETWLLMTNSQRQDTRDSALCASVRERGDWTNCFHSANASGTLSRRPSGCNATWLEDPQAKTSGYHKSKVTPKPWRKQPGRYREKRCVIWTDPFSPTLGSRLVRQFWI